MKFIRYRDFDGSVSYAEGSSIQDALQLEGNPFSGFTRTNQKANVAKLLSPVEPAIVFGIGLNYRRHAEETGASLPTNPVLFFKGPNTVQNPGDPIVLPRHLKSDEVDYECELAVVIKETCRNVPVDKALDKVLGYTCANDVSARDWQKIYAGGQWCRGKTFDTFLPMGPWLVTADEIPDPQILPIRTVLNGETMQESNTSDMIFTVAELVAYLSGSTTLYPGSIIITGTPEGVGMARKPPRWLQAGDQVTVEIDGIGSLTNPVIEEDLS